MHHAVAQKLQETRSIFGKYNLTEIAEMNKL